MLKLIIALLLSAQFQLFAVKPNGGGADDDAGAGDAGDAGDDAAGGEVSDDDGAAGDDGQGAGAGQGKAGDEGVALGDMAAAIKKGLQGEQDKQAAPAAAAKPATDDDKALGADGKPAAKPGDAAAGEVKDKKADDFKLTDADKKVLTAGAQQRFHELHKLAKAREDEVTTLKQTNTELEAARQQILGVFEETKTDPETLGRLLDFNFRVQTGDLEGALKIVNEQRAMILKAMGREEPGVDLLADHPDLKQQVEDERISREMAVELATRRDREKAQREQQGQQDTGQRLAAQLEQKSQDALRAIDAWALKMKREDANFSAREAKIQPRIANIIKTHRENPAAWLPMIEELYAVAAADAGGGTVRVPAGDQPLRPNGARPGSPEPKTMEEAIKRGLTQRQQAA